MPFDPLKFKLLAGDLRAAQISLSKSICKRGINLSCTPRLARRPGNSEDSGKKRGVPLGSEGCLKGNSHFLTSNSVLDFNRFLGLDHSICSWQAFSLDLFGQSTGSEVSEFTGQRTEGWCNGRRSFPHLQGAKWGGSLEKALGQVRRSLESDTSLDSCWFFQAWCLGVCCLSSTQRCMLASFWVS